MDQVAAEDAYHRLDGAFLELSDEALRVQPSARLHLYRAAAARLWMAPLDAAAELASAAQLAEQPEDVSLAAALTTLVKNGPVGAAEAFVAHADAFPDDALAHALRTAALVMSGVPGNRERVFALMDEDAPRLGGDWRFDGGLAMVRQEQCRYDEARRLAEHVLAEQPAAAHAVHALAHVHYETGEHAAGMNWLDEWQADRELFGYATHFRWHAALHALALGDLDEALRRYDRGIGPAAIADAGSLLWRCRLAGVLVDDAALEAKAGAAPALEALPMAFAVFNAGLALAAAGDGDGLRALAARTSADARPSFADVVTPLALALAALVDGRPADAVRELRPVLAETPRLGGSNAQREVIEDTYIRALISSGQPDEAVTMLERRLSRRAHALDRQLVDQHG